MKAYLPQNFSFSPYAQACSFIFMLSPIPLFNDVLKSGKVEKLPNMQFPAMAVMQLGWTIYGLLVENQAIFRASGMALICQIIYSTLAFILQGRRGNILVLYPLLIALTLIYRETSPLILGTLVSVVQMLSSATNLELLLKSFRERNGGLYNMSAILMSIPAALIWGLYGFEVMDLAVIIPSLFDLVIFGLQMFCVLVFASGKEQEKEKSEEKRE